MNNKLCCNQGRPAPAIKQATRIWIAACAFISLLWCAPRAFCDAPQWMHDLVNAPLPPHDEKSDAVLLYSETNVTVVSADRFKTTVREAYKILRPQGRDRGRTLRRLS